MPSQTSLCKLFWRRRPQINKLRYTCSRFVHYLCKELDKCVHTAKVRTSLYHRKHSTYALVNLDSYLLYPSAGGRPYKQLHRPSKYRPDSQNSPSLLLTPPAPGASPQALGAFLYSVSQVDTVEPQPCRLILPLFIPGSHFIFH